MSSPRTGPSDFSISQSHFGLDFGTLDFGTSNFVTSNSGLTIENLLLNGAWHFSTVGLVHFENLDVTMWVSIIFFLNMHVQSICDPARGLLITVWQAPALQLRIQSVFTAIHAAMLHNPQYKMFNSNLINAECSDFCMCRTYTVGN